MDLNVLIEKSILANDVDGVKRILSLSLSSPNLFRFVQQSKNYDLIPLFLPMFNKDCVAVMAQICCDTIGTEFSKQVKKYFSEQLHNGVRILAIQAGKQGISYSELAAVYTNVSRTDYFLGCIEGDHDHLIPDNSGISYTYLGYYCSKKCMDKFGYSNKRVEDYLVGALAKSNLQTLEFLRSKGLNLNEHFNTRVLYYLEPDQIQFGLKHGLIITEDTWDKLKAARPQIYTLLQEQV